MSQLRNVPAAGKNFVKRAYVRRHGVVVHPTARFNGLPRIDVADGSKVKIERGVVLNSKWDSNAISCTRPTTLITTSSDAELTIGEHSGVSATIVSATTSIRIGNRVLIGSDCLITDSDHHPAMLKDVTQRRYARVRPQDSSPVEIEDDVFLGTRTIVLKGVRIGRGTVVAAGSVVTRDLPPMAICAGNPCKFVRWLQE